MNTSTLDLLNEIFRVCIVPLLGVLTTYLVGYLKSLKVDTNSDIANKYLEMLKVTVATCVEATNQTYVDALKDKDAFDEAAQKEAFQKTYDAVMAILSDDAKKYLEEAVGDLEKYIDQEIESTVKTVKEVA